MIKAGDIVRWDDRDYAGLVKHNIEYVVTRVTESGGYYSIWIICDDGSERSASPSNVTIMPKPPPSFFD